MGVTVLLPTYNERDNIGPLIERCREVLRDREHEIVVVDDDSPDGTAEVASAFASRDASIRVIVRRSGRSLACSLRAGIGAARHDIVAWMDADGSMPPEHLPRLLQPIEGDEADLVVGSRFVKGGGIKGQSIGKNRISWLQAARNLRGTEDPLAGVMLSYLGNRLLQAILTPSFRDWTSGFVAIRASVLAEIPIEGDYGEYFLALVYRAIRLGCRVREVPYVILPRMHGTSKTANSLPDYARRARQYIGLALRVRFDNRPVARPERSRPDGPRGGPGGA